MKNPIIAITINATKPIAKIADRTENNQAINGNKHTMPPPMSKTPKHPGKRLSSELLSFFPEFSIAYPIGIAITAIISPDKTSSPPGKPKSGASESYPLPLGSAIIFKTDTN